MDASMPQSSYYDKVDMHQGTMSMPQEGMTVKGMDSVPMDAAMNELRSMLEQYWMLAERMAKQLSPVMRPEEDVAGLPSAPSPRGSTPLTQSVIDVVEGLRKAHAQMIDMLGRVDI